MLLCLFYSIFRISNDRWRRRRGRRRQIIQPGVQTVHVPRFVLVIASSIRPDHGCSGCGWPVVDDRLQVIPASQLLQPMWLLDDSSHISDGRWKRGIVSIGRLCRVSTRLDRLEILLRCLRRWPFNAPSIPQIQPWPRDFRCRRGRGWWRRSSFPLSVFAVRWKRRQPGRQT